MIQYLTHNQINKSQWDACVHQSSNSGIYALSWYLDVVSPQWEALVLDDYSTVMPLTRKKKISLSYLAQPHFAQQLGIYSGRKLAAEDLVSFLNNIPPKFKYIDIFLNSENSALLKENNLIGFRAKKNSNYLLDSSPGYTVLFSGFAENTRRNIRKAQNAGITLSRGQNNLADLIRIFKQNKGSEFHHLNNNYYRLLARLAAAAQTHKAIKIYRAYTKENDLCGGAVFFIHHNKAYFIFSATNETALRQRAMFYLIDRFIFDHAAQGIVLDFEGSNDTNLARFYKSFGAKESVYLQLRKNNLPGFVKWLKE